MNLFRSEEHARRWRDGGAIISVTTLSELAHAWWADRIAPDWRPHTLEQNAAILDRLRLVGEFWQLA
jgi:hypothetical protein